MCIMKITKHEGKSYFSGWAGLELYFEEHRPDGTPKASVVLVHGYAQHSGWLAPLTERLVEGGFSVFAFDLRGHGRSEGIRGDVVHFSDHVRDITTFVDYVREQSDGRKVFVVAQSLGASASAYYASTGKAEIDGLVLLGLYVKDAGEYARWKHIFGRMLAPFFPLVPIQHLESERVALDPGVGEAYRNDPLIYLGGVRIRMGVHFMDMEKYLENVPGSVRIPLLVVHGKEDGLASIDGCRSFYNKAASADKQFIEVENSGHDVVRDYSAKTVIEDVLRWLDEHL